MKYTVEKELSDRDVEDILATAIEGGIGYWACLLNNDPQWEAAEEEIEKTGEKPYYSTVMWKVLSEGGSVRFQDADDAEEGEIWDLTMGKFVRGCQIYEQQRGSLKKCLDDGGFDAIEADCLIQYALFGDVIYG